MTNGTHTSPEEHVPPTDYRGKGWLFWLHRLPRTISKPEDARELCEVMMRTGAGVAGDPHFLSEALQFWIRAQPPSLRIREEEVWARVVVERYPLAWKALAKWLGDTESGAAGEARRFSGRAARPL